MPEEYRSSIKDFSKVTTSFTLYFWKHSVLILTLSWFLSQSCSRYGLSRLEGERLSKAEKPALSDHEEQAAKKACGELWGSFRNRFYKRKEAALEILVIYDPIHVMS